MKYFKGLTFSIANPPIDNFHTSAHKPQTLPLQTIISQTNKLIGAMEEELFCAGTCHTIIVLMKTPTETSKKLSEFTTNNDLIHYSTYPFELLSKIYYLLFI